MTASVPAIRTENLSKRYGNHVAVSDLNLTIEAGTVFGFLGPNGAGKTTTIRMLLGLARPTSGRAVILGCDAGARSTSNVGAMVEQPAFFDYLSATDNMRVFAAAAGLNTRSVEIGDILERVGLSSTASQRTGRYSLGMKQRLSIAIALLGDPELLFLDEPTNGLDPEGALEIRSLLLRLREDGKTIFLSTHLLADMERVCSHIGIIHDGRLLRSGALTEVLEGGTIAVRVNSVEAALRTVPNSRSPKAGWIEVHAEAAAAPQVTRALVQAGIDVFEVSASGPSLEELYFSIVGGQKRVEVRAAP